MKMHKIDQRAETLRLKHSKSLKKMGETLKENVSGNVSGMFQH